MSSFKGGIHLPEWKHTEQMPIITIPLPQTVAIPLTQHIGSSAKAVVGIGDMVKTGQLLAESTGFVSANIHASISGKVVAIEERLHPGGFPVETIVIASDSHDEKIEFQAHQLEQLSREEIIALIQQAGVVGLGGAAFPTHVKLSPPPNKPVETIILNGCECEPYLTCDHRVMHEETEKVIGGLQIIMKVLQVDKAYIAIEDNKMGVVQKIRQATQAIPGISIVPLKTKYPQGAEKQVIKSVLKTEVPLGKLPLDIGCIIQNVQTARAVYEAVAEGKSLYERVLTVAGSVARPGNYRVRVGTTLATVIENAGGLVGEVKKVVVGGPMMGTTQTSLDVPVLKGTSGIIVLTDKEAKSYTSSNCIRCGRCVAACPMGLLPTVISRMVDKNQYDTLAEYNPMNCMECGCCTYECPAKNHLIQNLKLAKLYFQKKA